MGKRLDLNDLANPEDPIFLDILAIAPSRVRNSQLKRYFTILIDDFYEAKQRYVKNAVITAICKTIYLTNDNLSVFVEFEYIKELTISDETLNLFYVLAEKAPESLNCMRHQISQAIPGYPKHMLFIIASYCRRFEEMEDPWPISELLLEHLDSFKAKELAEDYVSLLAYLVNLSVDFRNVHGQECWNAICTVMKMKNENVVQRCYAALTRIADLIPDIHNFPMDLVSRHLTKSYLQRSCISLLLHTTLHSVTKELIAALFAIAKTDLKATLVLMKLASSRQVSQVILSDSEWMLCNLPTHIDTIRLFAVILGNKMLRSSIASKPETPQFFTKLLTLESAQSLNVACTFLRRLPLDEVFIQKLSEREFFTTYFSMAFNSENMGIVQSGFFVANTVAVITYIDEFRPVIRKIVEFVKNESTVMKIALQVGLSLCRYRQCAKSFKQKEFHRVLRVLRKDPRFTAIATKFLNSLADI